MFTVDVKQQYNNNKVQIQLFSFLMVLGFDFNELCKSVSRYASVKKYNINLSANMRACVRTCL